jgi:hypothetical protein
MSNQKNARKLMNELGASIAALRNALTIAEENEWDDFYGLDEAIHGLIDLSNLAEQIV